MVKTEEHFCLVARLSELSVGYQGFIKVSLTILGPGDEQLSHDLDAEYQKELAEEADQSTGFGIVALEGPNIDVCESQS